MAIDMERLGTRELTDLIRNTHLTTHVLPKVNCNFYDPKNYRILTDETNLPEDSLTVAETVSKFVESQKFKDASDIGYEFQGRLLFRGRDVHLFTYRDEYEKGKLVGIAVVRDHSN